MEISGERVATEFRKKLNNDSELSEVSRWFVIIFLFRSGSK